MVPVHESDFIFEDFLPQTITMTHSYDGPIHIRSVDNYQSIHEAKANAKPDQQSAFNLGHERDKYSMMCIYAKRCS